jgi:putative nucleotidyltransferase with HDIG domain
MAGALEAARSALRDEEAWLVGGAVRDSLLGRPTADIDVVTAADTAGSAAAIARAAGGAVCFALSKEFGSWRVLARDRSWQIDLEPLRGGSLRDDLSLRDFTVNAIAQPLGGGEAIDPLEGARDLRERRLRMAGPGAFAADPLRILRLVRLAVELGLEPERQTAQRARAHAASLADVSPERVFAELRRILCSARARAGIEMLEALGACAVVLPELPAMRGVEQNRYHHLDVHGHTLEVLDRTVALTGTEQAALDPQLAECLGGSAPAVRALLAEPLADEHTRGEALRWGALLHDAAKPLTRQVHQPGARVSFIGHDQRGAELARSVLGRLRASERLSSHVAALVAAHLRLGFLVHEPQPLARETVFAYMRACSPVEVDVTVLSVLDRLSTRGDNAEPAIAAHLALAGRMLGDALRWRSEGPPRPLLRGDELARELAIPAGPELGELLERLSCAQYAGEVADRHQALAYTRKLAQNI